jgi:hypothetical protein
MARSIRKHAELTILSLMYLTLARSREGRGEQKALHAEKQTPIK